jgi:hypothetical protein
VVEEPLAVVEEPLAVVEEPLAVVEEPLAVVEEPLAAVEESVKAKHGTLGEVEVLAEETLLHEALGVTGECPNPEDTILDSRQDHILSHLQCLVAPPRIIMILIIPLMILMAMSRMEMTRMAITRVLTTLAIEEATWKG